jgi:hypothetical protein
MLWMRACHPDRSVAKRRDLQFRGPFLEMFRLEWGSGQPKEMNLTMPKNAQTILCKNVNTVKVTIRCSTPQLD